MAAASHRANRPHRFNLKSDKNIPIFKSDEVEASELGTVHYPEEVRKRQELGEGAENAARDLQDALSCGLLIPTPEVTKIDKKEYNEIYRKRVKKPKNLIRMYDDSDRSDPEPPQRGCRKIRETLVKEKQKRIPKRKQSLCKTVLDRPIKKQGLLHSSIEATPRTPTTKRIEQAKDPAPAKPSESDSDNHQSSCQVFSPIKLPVMLSQRGLISLVIGTAVRFALYFTGFGSIMQKRVEVSTPSNSWLSVQEGVYLMSKQISPYNGDTVHETPLALLLAYNLIKLSTPLMIFVYFVVVDILTATLLGYTVDKFKDFYLMNSQKGSKHTKSQNGVDLRVKPEDPYGASVFMAYYVNPAIVANCLGQTTTVLVNFFLALAVFGMADGFFYLVVIGLCGAIYQSFYPMVLIFPACICIYNKYCARNINGKGCSDAFKLLQLFRIIVTLVFAVVGGFVLLLNISNNDFGWGFLDRTYGFILNVRDLKPNIGLFWYFFTEMFEHFHLLFICTFQINAFIYVIPLTIRFYDEPPLLVYALCTLMTIFKSYPCVGDVGFYLSFLPMWKHIFPFMQQKFLVGCFFIATTVLAPIQWYLWIYSGSANANFYFGVTIAFGTAQIFLLTDILLAHLKREYFLKHGVQKKLNGKPVGLSLT